MVAKKDDLVLVPHEPNPSPAAKGGEDGALKTIEAAVKLGMDAHDSDGGDDDLSPFRKAFGAIEVIRAALATPSPQPADAVREAAQAYIEAQDAEPENECWDTDSGEAEEGAKKFASDWAWADYHERVQEARNTLRAALSTPTEGPASQTEGMGGLKDMLARVKPLVWHDRGPWPEIEAGHGFGPAWSQAYPPYGPRIDIYSGDGGKTFLAAGFAGRGFSTLEEAKAAAQDDYARRICFALTPPETAEAVPVDKATFDRLCLWFFRDLHEAQRLALFKLFGWPVEEITDHGREKMVFRKIVMPGRSASSRGGK